ncbi:MAG: septum formation initiator family protein [Tagaea sp.]|nr:septum formation initiator family protein [Tagaea sp.]
MVLVDFLKRSLQAAIGPVLGFCVVGYFAYHSFEGERGVHAFLRLGEQVAIARAHLDDLREERGAIERRVALLRGDSLDRDMLDEQVRALLNFARPDEIVVLEPPQRRR